MPLFDINEKPFTYIWMRINNYSNISKALTGSKSESIKTRV
jgi:hypothetical protein